MPYFCIQAKQAKTPVSKTLKSTCTDPTFGMVLATDELSNYIYIKSKVAKKSASKLFSSLPATRNKIQGAFIVDGDRILTKDDATTFLSRLCDQGSDSFTITFAPERILSAKAVRASANEYCLLAPVTKWTEDLPIAEISLINSKFAPTKGDDMDEHMPALIFILYVLLPSSELPMTSRRKVYRLNSYRL